MRSNFGDIRNVSKCWKIPEMSRCLITAHECVNFPSLSKQQFRDSVGEEQFGTAENEANCLKRAEDLHSWCGNQGEVQPVSLRAARRRAVCIGTFEEAVVNRPLRRAKGKGVWKFKNTLDAKPRLQSAAAKYFKSQLYALDLVLCIIMICGIACKFYTAMMNICC